MDCIMKKTLFIFACAMALLIAFFLLSNKRDEGKQEIVSTKTFKNGRLLVTPKTAYIIYDNDRRYYSVSNHVVVASSNSGVFPGDIVSCIFFLDIQKDALSTGYVIDSQSNTIDDINKTMYIIDITGDDPLFFFKSEYLSEGRHRNFYRMEAPFLQCISGPIVNKELSLPEMLKILFESQN